MQGRLEIVGRHQRREIERLRRIGQHAQAHDPVLILVDLFSHQRLQEIPFVDAANGRIHLLELPAEGIERLAVEQRCAAVHVQLPIRKGQSEPRFLHGAVGGVAIDQDAPRNERSLVFAGGSVGPSGAEQRLVRIGTVEPHAIERLLRAIEAGGLEHHPAEHHVRLVADRCGRRIAARDLARLLELLQGLGRVTCLQERYAKVVGGEASQALRALQLREYRHGICRAPESQVDVRAQELEVVANRFGDLAVDSLQSMQRVLRLVFLEMDARETERGFIADDLVDVRFQHRLDGAAGAMVHSVVELEVADIELRGGAVGMERVALRLVDSPMLRQFRVEPLERFEVAALRRLENRFPEIQVLEVSRRHGRRSQRRGQRQREQHVTRTGHAHQSPMLTAGWPESGPASVTPISLGLTAFVKAKCSL